MSWGGGHYNTKLTILALDTSPATVPAAWACRCCRPPDPGSRVARPWGPLVCVGGGGHNNTKLNILALDTSPATVPAAYAC